MGWTYNFIDHTADIALEIKGNSIEELFMAAAFGWKEAVSDSKVSSKEELSFALEEDSLEELLVRFLDELNFLFETKKLLMAEVEEIVIKKDENLFKLHSKIFGEVPDESKHQLKAEIKAVTFHQMDIRQEGMDFRTRIVFDI